MKKPINRSELLRAFDMITEEELAVLFGVEVKTLKNRPADDLPAFARTGGKRLFFKEDVIRFLRERKQG